MKEEQDWSMEALFPTDKAKAIMEKETSTEKVVTPNKISRLSLAVHLALGKGPRSKSIPLNPAEVLSGNIKAQNVVTLLRQAKDSRLLGINSPESLRIVVDLWIVTLDLNEEQASAFRALVTWRKPDSGRMVKSGDVVILSTTGSEVPYLLYSASDGLKYTDAVGKYVGEVGSSFFQTSDILSINNGEHVESFFQRLQANTIKMLFASLPTSLVQEIVDLVNTEAI